MMQLTDFLYINGDFNELVSSLCSLRWVCTKAGFILSALLCCAIISNWQQPGVPWEGGELGELSSLVKVKRVTGGGAYVRLGEFLTWQYVLSIFTVL